MSEEYNLPVSVHVNRLVGLHGTEQVPGLLLQALTPRLALPEVQSFVSEAS